MHSSATDTLTFTIDGVSQTFNLGPSVTGWNLISLMAKGSTSGPNVRTSNISNLMLDGNSLTNDTLTDSSNQKNGVRLTGEVFSDFTLSGDVTLSWVGTTPTGSSVEMFVGVGSAVPIPATVWLLGSGLGLLAVRRRRSAN